ncbi:MAG TPA: hypothetical protein VK478_12875 [Gemmatimonadaceae bacterium]|nr:hypothetical protein [Gemmatimonadaceae bacterium]
MIDGRQNAVTMGLRDAAFATGMREMLAAADLDFLSRDAFFLSRVRTVRCSAYATRQGE